MKALSARWMIDTFAGIGEPGFSGDGGPASQASLNEPKGVAIDSQGHLYVADSENHIIRKVDRMTGLISTVAGKVHGEGVGQVEGETGHVRLKEDDPLSESIGAINERNYTQQADLSGTVRYWINNGVAVKRYSGDDGPAAQAQLNFPTAVAVDRQGNLYIADTMNHRVRWVNGATGAIATLAGTGQARFSGDGGPAAQAALNEPVALALDEEGHLYIADQGNHRVRVVNLQTGIIQTIAGTGTATYDGDEKPAVQASLAGPGGLAAMGDRLYIADTFNGRVRCIQRPTGLISTVAGDGGTYQYDPQSDALSQSLSRPTGIALDRAGNLFLTDSDNHLVRCWDWKARAAVRIAGTGVSAYSGEGRLADEASLCYPFGIAVDADGTLFVADTFNHRIRTLSLEQRNL